MNAQAKKLGFDNLFQKGSVVDLDIGRWYAKASIKAEDLEIQNTEEVHKALSLGSYRLIPKKAFDEIAAELREPLRWAPLRAVARVLPLAALPAALLREAT